MSRRLPPEHIAALRTGYQRHREQDGRVGRRPVADHLAQRIVADIDAGVSYCALARQLTAEQVPTAQGGARWYPSTVKTIYDRVCGV